MSEQAQTYAPGQHPDLPAPVTTVGLIGWLRENLFSSIWSTVLTVLAGLFLLWIVPPVIEWAFIDAYWAGDTREACAPREGACWVFIKVWFRQLMYGRYPPEEIWRINTAYVILVATGALLFVPRFRWKPWIGLFLLVGYPLIALYLFVGLSGETVDAWPYRLMGFAALALGLLAVLPLFGILREWSAAVSIVLLVLMPLLGLSAPSTWTSGLLRGAPGFAVVLAIVLTVVPAVALVVGLRLAQWRALIAENFRQLSVATAVLAFIGFALPLLFWDEIAGPSPPWALAVTGTMLALAALCPWGYDDQAGLPGRLARILLPVYLAFIYLLAAGPPDFLNFGSLDWTSNIEPFFADVQTVIPFVETPLWGGLFLTLVIGGVGIVASLPIGVVLALGRRSAMPIVRAICIAFIELWRGVPLITVLFMASVMFPLFLPEGMNFDKLVRALLGVMLFSAAYMAEVVRGGLQALPKGQYEAAQALGLSYWKMMGLVILPQALKMVIPGIVNTFIGLFKDTTLVLIIGLFDFLGMVQLAGTNPDWLGFAIEGYVFAAFGFWIFCFSMSRYSQRLEKKLSTERR
ncbi:MAG: amino acid ABC transporter permease [Kiloniellaceae bacterium]